MGLPGQPCRLEVVSGLEAGTLGEYHALMAALLRPPRRTQRRVARDCGGTAGAAAAGGGSAGGAAEAAEAGSAAALAPLAPLAPLGPHYVVQVSVPAASELGHHVLALAGLPLRGGGPIDVLACRCRLEGLAPPAAPAAESGAEEPDDDGGGGAGVGPKAGRGSSRARPDTVRQFFWALEAASPPSVPWEGPSSGGGGAGAADGSGGSGGSSGGAGGAGGGGARAASPTDAMTRAGEARPLVVVAIPEACASYEQLRVVDVQVPRLWVAILTAWLVGAPAHGVPLVPLLPAACLLEAS
jgi:hypothetical protein